VPARSREQLETSARKGSCSRKGGGASHTFTERAEGRGIHLLPGKESCELKRPLKQSSQGLKRKEHRFLLLKNGREARPVNYLLEKNLCRKGRIPRRAPLEGILFNKKGDEQDLNVPRTTKGKVNWKALPEKKKEILSAEKEGGRRECDPLLRKIYSGRVSKEGFLYQENRRGVIFFSRGKKENITLEGEPTLSRHERPIIRERGRNPSVTWIKGNERTY